MMMVMMMIVVGARNHNYVLEIIIASISGNLSWWLFCKLYLTDFRKIRLASVGEITINRMTLDYSRRILENIIVSVVGALIDGFGENIIDQISDHCNC